MFALSYFNSCFNLLRLSRLSARLTMSGITLFWLSACVTTGGPARPPSTTPTASITDTQLNQISLLLPGRYGNFQQFHGQSQSTDGAKVPLLSLEISTPEDLSDRLDFSVTQETRNNSADQGGTRGFLWQVVPTERLLVLRITPRARNAQPCDVPLQAVEGGFAGQSDPRLCTVPSQQGPQLGIRKEIAIKPGSITLADQVIDLTSGQTKLNSRLEFQRMHEFIGWAGVKDESGEWQLAQAFQLHNDGAQVLLRGITGQSLGVRLQLARVKYRDDQPAILRLAVYKEDEIVAYGWADPNSPQVGINLDWFQAGLNFQR